MKSLMQPTGQDWPIALQRFGSVPRRTAVALFVSLPVGSWHFRLDGALGGSRLFVVSWLGDDSAAVLIMGRKSMKHGGHTGN